MRLAPAVAAALVALGGGGCLLVESFGGYSLATGGAGGGGAGGGGGGGAGGVGGGGGGAGGAAGGSGGGGAGGGLPTWRFHTPAGSVAVTDLVADPSSAAVYAAGVAVGCTVALEVNGETAPCAGSPEDVLWVARLEADGSVGWLTRVGVAPPPGAQSPGWPRLAVTPLAVVAAASALSAGAPGQEAPVPGAHGAALISLAPASGVVGSVKHLGKPAADVAPIGLAQTAAGLRLALRHRSVPGEATVLDGCQLPATAGSAAAAVQLDAQLVCVEAHQCDSAGDDEATSVAGEGSSWFLVTQGPTTMACDGFSGPTGGGSLLSLTGALPFAVMANGVDALPLLAGPGPEPFVTGHTKSAFGPIAASGSYDFLLARASGGALVGATEGGPQADSIRAARASGSSLAVAGAFAGALALASPTIAEVGTGSDAFGAVLDGATAGFPAGLVVTLGGDGLQRGLAIARATDGALWLGGDYAGTPVAVAGAASAPFAAAGAGAMDGFVVRAP